MSLSLLDVVAEAGSQFAADLEALRGDLQVSRDQLLEALSRLSDAELDRARRGGWPIRRVLEHVLDSEWLYIAGLANLQSQSAPPAAEGQPQDVQGWIEALEITRKNLLNLLEGASAETFYELRQLGHEEYSVFSILENVAMHDREHAAQIEQVLASSP